MRHSFGDLGRWQTMLRSLANQLEDLQTRAKHVPILPRDIEDADSAGMAETGSEGERQP